jgi:hypothetical protein
MSKIRAALDAVAHTLGLSQKLLGRAQRRAKKFHRKAKHNLHERDKAKRQADRYRALNHPARAAAEDAKAGRCEARRARSSAKAQFWTGRVKVLTQRIHGLEVRQDKLSAELKRLTGPRVEGNRVKGGSSGERWRAACLTAVSNCASGRRRNFYSQSGSWDVKHEIEPGPAYGERSDCSQFLTGMAWSARLPDPNGADFTGGYTGTLIGQHDGWIRVSRSHMERKGWGYVVYGGGTGHHTEAYIGPGDRTAGHGSAPVDFGVINLFGDGDYSCFIYDPS